MLKFRIPRVIGLSGSDEMMVGDHCSVTEISASVRSPNKFDDALVWDAQFGNFLRHLDEMSLPKSYQRSRRGYPLGREDEVTIEIAVIATMQFRSVESHGELIRGFSLQGALVCRILNALQL